MPEKAKLTKHSCPKESKEDKWWINNDRTPLHYTLEWWAEKMERDLSYFYSFDTNPLILMQLEIINMFSLCKGVF